MERIESQKIDNILNLAFDATKEERAKSQSLDTGYNPIDETWDVIIKYSGDIQTLRERGLQVVELLNEYAIVTASQMDIELISLMPTVEYIEKPKRLYFERENAQEVSGITRLREANELDGSGIIIAILDSGIDYHDPEFIDNDGRSRILNLWDQTIEGNPPTGYFRGSEYTRADINRALDADTLTKSLAIVPSVDTSGHGTEVAGIAVGNNGVASGADIIIVKLGIPKIGGFPRSIELMEGLNYAITKALNYQKPISVNISFGNTYGAHTGSSLLERYIDDMANFWKTVICVGAGNEGNEAGHVDGHLTEDVEERIEIAIAQRQTAINLQIWKYLEDEVDIRLLTPSGELIGPLAETIGAQRHQTGDTEILIYYGTPSPSAIEQEIYIEFIPQDSYIESGVWTVLLTPKKIITGLYNIWLPSYVALNKGTNFLRPSKELTITIPATASRVITVGAYDPRTLTYADFSGRGKYTNPQLLKPDLVAPGKDIITTGLNGQLVSVTGTSFATPFITGGAALLMEWGIVKGNDEFLYGEKMKARLRKQAREVLGEEVYPNVRVGYGRFVL